MWNKILVYQIVFCTWVEIFSYIWRMYPSPHLGNWPKLSVIDQILNLCLLWGWARATIKVTGNTLGSLLCIYLKRMHAVQRLISTGFRDIHNWIKDERIIFKCWRTLVTRRLRKKKGLFKSYKRALNGSKPCFSDF